MAQVPHRLYADLPYTPIEIIWSARYDMARTVEDILARRQRALFLDARAAVTIAPEVARILAGELRKSKRWQQEQVREFTEPARGCFLED